MGRVFMAGVGFTQVGDHWDKSILDLGVEAGVKALRSRPEIRPELVLVGNMFSGQSSRQEQLGALIADGLGLGRAGAYKVEAACASGGAALHAGYSHVKAGEADALLVLGVEKMRDLEPREVSLALAMADSYEYTAFFGATLAALNAMLARLYMHSYDVKRDALSVFPVISHRNAVTAEHAQFRKAITIEDVAKAPMVSDPLSLLDCSPVGDGAASALLVSEDVAKELDGGLVEVASSVVATNRFSVYERDDMLAFEATAKATSSALSRAGLSLGDIDFVEVHDAFSITAALSLEAMGFSKRGEAARDAWDGRYDRAGEVPMNTFGGLKARGHPVGATGVYQVVEAYLQLTDRAGENQVKGAKAGMTHSVGGADTTAVLHILRRG